MAKEIEQKQIGFATEVVNVKRLISIIQSMTKEKEQYNEMGHLAEKLYEEQYAMEIGLKKYSVIMGKIIN